MYLLSGSMTLDSTDDSHVDTNALAKDIAEELCDIATRCATKVNYALLDALIENDSNLELRKQELVRLLLRLDMQGVRLEAWEDASVVLELEPGGYTRIYSSAKERICLLDAVECIVGLDERGVAEPSYNDLFSLDDFVAVVEELRHITRDIKSLFTRVERSVGSKRRRAQPR